MKNPFQYTSDYDFSIIGDYTRFREALEEYELFKLKELIPVFCEFIQANFFLNRNFKSPEWYLNKDVDNYSKKVCYYNFTHNRIVINMHTLSNPASDMMFLNSGIFYFTFKEYEWLESSKTVGAFKTTNYDLIILGSLCHEFAHVVQNFHIFFRGFDGALSINNKKAFDRKGHNWQFRWIYRKLRNEFVNPYIEKG